MQILGASCIFEELLINICIDVLYITFSPNKSHLRFISFRLVCLALTSTHTNMSNIVEYD